MGKSFIKAETQPVVDDIKNIEAQGYKGSIVLRSDDLKTKWLAITAKQAESIQAILLGDDN